jgi:hypothetical protein
MTCIASQTGEFMIRSKTLTALAFGSAIALGTAAPVMAQDAPAQEIDGAALIATDTKLDAFITAALAVNAVRQEYIGQLEGVEDEARAQELIEAANVEIVQAVENADGITLDEYVAMGEAASNDQELKAQIDTRFREMAPSE